MKKTAKSSLYFYDFPHRHGNFQAKTLYPNMLAEYEAGQLPWLGLQNWTSPCSTFADCAEVPRSVMFYALYHGEQLKTSDIVRLSRVLDVKFSYLIQPKLSTLEPGTARFLKRRYRLQLACEDMEWLGSRLPMLERNMEFFKTVQGTLAKMMDRQRITFAEWRNAMELLRRIKQETFSNASSERKRRRTTITA